MCPRPADPLVRDALLDAARTEFALHGIDAARLEDITCRAGVSKGAFYLHFKSKEGAYREILERFFGVLEELVRRQQEAEEEFVRSNGVLTDDDVARRTERFERAFEVECSCDVEVLETLWRNRKMLAILDSAGGNRYVPILDSFRHRMADLVVRTAFSKKASSCLRPDIDRAAVGDLVVGAYESFARRMQRMRRKPDLGAWARSILIVLRQGALAPSCEASSVAGAMPDTATERGDGGGAI